MGQPELYFRRMAAGMLAFLAVTAGATSGILISVLNSKSEEQRRIEMLELTVKDMVRKLSARTRAEKIVDKYVDADGNIR